MITLEQLNQNFSFTEAAKNRIATFAMEARARKLVPHVVSIMETKLIPKDGCQSINMISIGFFTKAQADKFPKDTIAHIGELRVAFGLAPDRYKHFFGKTLDVDDYGIFFLT
jgi:hypothetical protein